MKRLRKDRGGSRVHLVLKRGIDNKTNEQTFYGQRIVQTMARVQICKIPLKCICLEKTHFIGECLYENCK